MSPTLLVTVAVLVALALAVGALRVRKLRRDERRVLSRPLDRRLVSPPPSPYQPSRGFRLLDGADPHEVRPTPSRPRLEASRDYVFSELSGPAGEERPTLPNRHSADWALARSQHRGAGGGGLRFVVIVIVLVAGVSVVGYALRHRSAPHATPTSTSTAPTTTTTWPASFVAVATDAANKTATYSVPAASYVVSVTGAAGAVWAVYRMGAANTLEFQGTVGSGHTESLRLSGAAQLTLGSPRNASVRVGGSPVTLPTPLTAPLTLFFTPAG